LYQETLGKPIADSKNTELKAHTDGFLVQLPLDFIQETFLVPLKQQNYTTKEFTIQCMKKSAIITTLLFINTLLIHAQDTQKILEFANSQYDKQNYQLALKEYQRVLFYTQNYTDTFLLLKIANAFNYTNNPEKAIAFYDIAYNLVSDTTIMNEITFTKAQLYIKNKQAYFALAELLTFNNLKNTNQTKLYNFYCGICYFTLENYNKAYLHFSECLSKTDTLLLHQLTKLYNKKSSFFYPNPNTAKILSMAFPGMGQLYSGDYKNSINSFLLTTSLLTLGINISIKYKPLDAFLAIFPWFQRYHQGGFTHAKEIAIYQRNLNRSKTFNKTIEILNKSN